MITKKILAVIVAACAALSVAYAQKMPDNIKAQLREKAAKLYPNDKHEEKMWFSNQFYAWQALQVPNSSIPEEDQKLVVSAAEKQFPLDFVAQSKYITDIATAYEALGPAKKLLGEDGFKKVKQKALKDCANDILKATAQINAQAEAKKQLDEIKVDDAAKLEQTKADLAKKFDGDYVSQLKEAQTVFNIKSASGPIEVVKAGELSSGARPIRVESAYEKTKRFNKQAIERFTVVTCRNKESITGSYVNLLDKDCILLPVRVPSDILEADIVSNLGEKIEYDKNIILINKNVPLILLVPKELPKGSQVLKFIDKENWAKLIGTQFTLVGRLKEAIKAYPLVANSLGEMEVNVDPKLPFGIENGAMYINPESGDVGGILITTKPPYKMPSDFTKLNEVSKLVASIKTNKYNYEILRLDTLSEWEKLDLKKFENQTKEFDRLNEVFGEFLDFYTSGSLRNLMQKKYLGRAAKRAFEEMDVKRLKKEEHIRRYKNYLNSVKTILIMEIKKIKPEEFYSIYRQDVERIKTTMEAMLEALDNLIKGDYTRFMRQDSNPFRLH